MKEIEVFETIVKKDIKIRRLSVKCAAQLFQRIMANLRERTREAK